MTSRTLCWALVAAALCRAPLASQEAPTAEHRPAGLTTIGSARDVHARLDQLLGRDTARGGYLLRSPSSLTPRGPNGFRVLLPEVETVWNSDIPYSVNDGPLWAGRGASARFLAGFVATAGRVRLIVAPEVVWSRNAAFDSVLPRNWTGEERAAFRPPWLAGTHSADLPWRFGDTEVRRVFAGQSSLSADAGPLVVGAATESQWWGPGIRNAILFSNNAPGFPHLFVRTGRPLRTPLGDVEGRWMVGGLSASPFAADSLGQGRRSVAALGVTLQPAGAPGLTLGLSRSVYSPLDGWGGVPGRALDVLGQWSAGRDTAGRAAEQMTSLTARWVAPGDGAEVYVEWARREMPESFRDVLTQPDHSQGYTLGSQLARPVGRRVLRLLAEHTYLEKSPSFRSRPIGSYYASARVPEGYTEQGQVIGAAVGPGASGQWLAVDLVGGRAEAGLFAGRTRWANDAYYDYPRGFNRYRAHDVTVLGGLRGSLAVRGMRLGAEWTAAQRWNFMFQNFATSWETRDNAVNVFNHTLRLSLSPAPARLPETAEVEVVTPPTIPAPVDSAAPAPETLPAVPPAPAPAPPGR